jgi:hypothetical protein
MKFGMLVELERLNNVFRLFLSKKYVCGRRLDIKLHILFYGHNPWVVERTQVKFLTVKYQCQFRFRYERCRIFGVVRRFGKRCYFLRHCEYISNIRCGTYPKAEVVRCVELCNFVQCHILVIVLTSCLSVDRSVCSLDHFPVTAKAILVQQWVPYLDPLLKHNNHCSWCKNWNCRTLFTVKNAAGTFILNDL